MLKKLRQFFTGVTIEDMKEAVKYYECDIPNMSPQVLEMTIEYAYRFNLSLQQVLDIQKN